MTNLLSQTWRWLLDLVFPIRCLGCGIFGLYLCGPCLNKVVINKKFECIGCKRETPLGRTCYFCERDSGINNLYVAADYRQPLIERSLKLYKYSFIQEMSEPLALILQNYLKWIIKEKKVEVFEVRPLVIPIPLARRRLNWRGFNQSELLASFVAYMGQAELATNIIKRQKMSLPQAEVAERAMRLQNIKGAFSLKEGCDLNGREILLIDDVCTTGATLNECAQLLKSAGAKKVSALVVARG